MTSSVLGTVLGHLCQLDGSFVRHGRSSPNLAVRVRIRASHRRSFVFKNLHVAKLRGRLRNLVWKRNREYSLS
jgi:hypothetical protein